MDAGLYLLKDCLIVIFGHYSDVFKIQIMCIFHVRFHIYDFIYVDPVTTTGYVATCHSIARKLSDVALLQDGFLREGVTSAVAVCKRNTRTTLPGYVH